MILVILTVCLIQTAIFGNLIDSTQTTFGKKVLSVVANAACVGYIAGLAASYHV